MHLISKTELLLITFLEKKRKKGLLGPFLFLLFLCAISAESNGQIVLQSGATAAVLAQTISGQGVSVSNPTLNCASVANAVFTATTSNLGMSSGIVLTTGRAATQGNAYGVNGNSALLASNDNNMPGDAQLDALAGMTTLDACDLEFDVTPLGDTIKFDYVFTSEEYINSVCGPFNDAFAFFISGPGIAASENMALVPGTNIPVTINSINNGIPGPLGNDTNCTSMGPGSPFTSYYIDNTTGQTLTHKGLTTVMQAIHAVQPCNTYHLKIVIADGGDNPLYDSGVFLKAGSLQTSSFSLAALVSLPDLVPSPICIKECLPGQITVKRSQANGTAQTLLIQTAGAAISGYDYSPLPDSMTIPAFDSSVVISIHGLATPLNGARDLKVYLHAPHACAGTSSVVDSATITLYDTVDLQVAFADTTICEGSRLQLSASGSELISFSWTPTTGLSNPAVANPIVEPSGTIQYTVTGFIPGTTCPEKTANVFVGIKPIPLLMSNTDTVICFNHPITLSPFLLSENVFYSYRWVGPDSFYSNLKSPVIDTLTTGNSGIYTLTVTLDTDDCLAQELVQVNAYIPPMPEVLNDSVFCTGDANVALNVAGTAIQWYSAPSDTIAIRQPQIQTAIPGNVQFFVTQTIRQCESPREPVNISVKNCCDGKIFIPTAFSPNNDGRNDEFIVHPDYGYYVKEIIICNRWGETVHQGNDAKWDGRAGGINCEAGTYFYLLKLGCIRGGEVVKRGDITLIR